MNIVILDGYAVNPGDLSWDKITALSDQPLAIYDRTDPDQVIERARGKQIILTNKARLDAETLHQLPDLAYIGIIATGYNTVDVAEARKRKIPVCNAPGYGRDSVAQHVFALLFELTNQVGLHARSTAAGEWAASPDWTYQKAPMTELADKTMGIVGLGEIGSQVARIALALGMRVLGNNRSPKVLPGVEMVSPEQLFTQSDVVSLNCPLTDENRGFVDAALLNKMKPTAFLLNTARGPLIDEDALATALNEGRLAGAGLDVLSTEPPAINHPLFRTKNCIITPHNAWGTRESRARLLHIVEQNLQAFLSGTPVNVVNPI